MTVRTSSEPPVAVRSAVGACRGTVLSDEIDQGAVTHVIYEFGDCVLDTATQELMRQGEPVPVEPQVFAVLELLIVNRDRVVTKIDLLDHVWGDRFVSESALTSRIKLARQACGDSGRAQRLIKTVHGLSLIHI